MNERYFLSKGNSALVFNGKQIRFEPCCVVAGKWWATLAVTDAAEAQFLTTAGGVKEITKADYDAYEAQKKSSPLRPREERRFPQVRPAAPAPAAAANDPAAVIAEVPPATPDISRDGVSIDDLVKTVPVLQTEATDDTQQRMTPEAAFANNYDALAVALGTDLDTITSLAKIDGAPKRNPRKGYNIADWRRHKANWMP
jgi:hypothetical protein